MPRRDDIEKAMIIGSGPIVIGQAAEFGYSGTQACKAPRHLGYQIAFTVGQVKDYLESRGMPVLR